MSCALPLPVKRATPTMYEVEVALIDAHTREHLPAFAPDGSLLDTNFISPVKIATPSLVEPPIKRRLK